jgi:hypothetical protein
MGEVTQILRRVADGYRHSCEELLSLLYDELRRLAAAAEAMRWILIEKARQGAGSIGRGKDEG